MTLHKLFDYQMFAVNPRLQKKLDAVYAKYVKRGEELTDDELDVAAAGDVAKRRDADGDA